MAAVKKIKVQSGLFQVSISPPNKEVGRWCYEVSLKVVDGKGVATVKNTNTGVTEGDYPLNKIRKSVIISLCESIAEKYKDKPPKKTSNRIKKPKCNPISVKFVVELDGACSDGSKRQLMCEIRWGTMTIGIEQPDGRTFVGNAPERFTATFYRLNADGKKSGQASECPCASITFDEVARIALIAESEIRWVVRKSTPKKNTLEGYSAPPCDECGKDIGESAHCVSFPPDTSRKLLCQRCMNKFYDTSYEFHGAPDELLQRHLTKKRGPYEKLISYDSCSKCSRELKNTYYPIGFIPTQKEIVLCPSCWSRATLHEGWRCQLDFSS